MRAAPADVDVAYRSILRGQEAGNGTQQISPETAEGMAVLGISPEAAGRTSLDVWTLTPRARVRRCNIVNARMNAR
jgi:hypothetical protein